MARTEVHKFGGTSVLNADRICNAVGILLQVTEGGTRIACVTSALGGVTDDLLAMCELAKAGKRTEADQAAIAMQDRHQAALAAICQMCEKNPESDDARAVLEDVNGLFEELRELAHGTALIRELTARTRDRVLATGEKAATRLLSFAIRAKGGRSRHLDADTFLNTTDDFGEADPLSYTDCPEVGSVVTPLLDSGEVPVITGFCGRASDGATTTFGRGGSDFTATLVGAALRAEEVTIWTDVPGVFSADPRIVKKARVIDHLHFREAAEMSYYGAKVLHPRTMIPIAGYGIPVRIRSSLEPELIGTVVNDSPPAAGSLVKSISAIKRQAMLSVEGKGMVGVPGVAGRVFTTLARVNISVTMISQSSSESSVCFAVPEADAHRAVDSLTTEFERDLREGLMESVRAENGLSLVAVVGLGMAHTPGIAARTFSAIATKGINVLAIAQGSSELNITLAIPSESTDACINVVHDAFMAD